MCNAQLSTSRCQELLICVTAGQAVALQTHLKNTQSDLDAFHLILDPYLISQECSQGSEGPFFLQTVQVTSAEGDVDLTFPEPHSECTFFSMRGV